MSPLHGLIKELKPISKENVQGEPKGKKTTDIFFPFTTINIFDNFLSSFFKSTISNYSVLKILTNNKN